MKHFRHVSKLQQRAEYPDNGYSTQFVLCLAVFSERVVPYPQVTRRARQRRMRPGRMKG